ncbi:MAG: hypothetical protein LBM60_06220 [Clostridium sp.]|jgi:hypothetical protein|nr:hypothetical protein [Clostridium sp.]
MGIRKSMEEKICLEGTRDRWLPVVRSSLANSGFKNIICNDVLFQVTADYKKATVWGELLVTLTPSAAGNRTDLIVKSTANVDNIYALFKSPNKVILDAFKSGLGRK